MKLLLAFILCTPVILAQGYPAVGARSLSMGGSSLCLPDVWAFNNNPGALGEIESFTASAFYNNQFSLTEFQNQSIAIAQPLNFGVISAGAVYSGFSEYQHYKAGLGYSMKLSEKLFAGVQMNYHGLSLGSEYGQKGSLTGEFGLQTLISANWRIGVSVMNMGRARLSDYQDDRWTTLMRLGTSYNFSDKVLITAEVEKDLDRPVVVKTGIEYSLIENLFLRGGIATQAVQFGMGFGYRFKSISIDLGSGYHQVLGWSPHVGLSYKHERESK